jgi:putative membrane protein
VHLVITILSIVIIALHLYFMWLEMFAWNGRAQKVFSGFDSAFFQTTRQLAANQGLYNGFLVAGLLWSHFIDDPLWGRNVAVFFLACISLAGVYGGLSISRKIFFVQAVPALITLGLIFSL